MSKKIIIRSVQWLTAGLLLLSAVLLGVAESAAESVAESAAKNATAKSATARNATKSATKNTADAVKNPSGKHAAKPYRIGPGDLISIIVYDEPDLSLEQVRVGSEGSVSFPLIGDVPIKGLSAKEIENRLQTLLLNGYLKNPKVSIAILEFRLFFISGQVKRPGGYPYVQGLSVRKAIALAGGMTVRGSNKKINKILEQTGEEVKVDINSKVSPGDTLYIGETFF